MVDDKEGESSSVTTETEPRVIRYAWPAIGVFLILVVGAIVHFSMGKYSHNSLGRFVGPNKCRECHRAQYDSWKKTRMANSFNVLRPGEKIKEKQIVGLNPDADFTQDKTCLPCHTTGYGLVGGFVSIEETPEMAGVSCEACHGYGGAYVKTVMNPKQPTFSTAEARTAGLIYPPNENVCRECHNARSPFIGMDYKFYFDERIKLGTHEHFHLKYEHGNR